MLIMLGSSIVEHVTYHAYGSGFLVLGSFIFAAATKIKYYSAHAKSIEVKRWPFTVL
jgi:hypothetical protein